MRFLLVTSKRKHMKWSLSDIWEQAKKAKGTINLDHNGEEARLLNGCKIKHDKATGEVVIVNTTTNGNYYTPITRHELNVFLKEGWEIGVNVLYLSNVRQKLDKIDFFIQSEINGNKNQKHIDRLKNSRRKHLNNYKIFSDKLKSLGYEH